MGPKFQLVKVPVQDAHVRTLDVQKKGKGPDPYVKASADVGSRLIQSRLGIPAADTPGFMIEAVRGQIASLAVP